MNWISVDRYLPQKEQLVLIWGGPKHAHDLARWTFDRWGRHAWKFRSSSTRQEDVTHWAELPEKPMPQKVKP